MVKLIKKMLPHTLFGRSLLILVTPILLIQIITTYIFFDRHWDRVTARLAFAVAGEVAIIADQIEQSTDPDNIKLISRYFEQELDLQVAFLPDQDFNSLARTTSLSFFLSKNKLIGSAVSETLSRAIEARVKRPYRIHVQVDEKWVEIALQLDNGVLVVVSPQRRLFSSTAYIFLLWMIGVSAVLLIVAVLFMRNQIRPIRRLAIAAEKIGMGRDMPFFKLEGAREVRQAGQAFLDMRERIDRQIAQRTDMLAGVSHDLRTPLTRMKLAVEMLDNPEQAAGLKNDMSDMERMITAYLDFARGEGSESPQRCDLTVLMRQICDGFARGGFDVVLDTPESLSIVLRPLAFERCLNNVIGNAQKYAQKAWVQITRMEEYVEIIIDDDGMPIPEDIREDVFKPFFRGEASRNQKTGGVGLGLPIAQDIVFSHGGTIALGESPQGGTRIVIQLPV